VSKKNKPSLVTVEWGDAWTVNGWQSISELDKEHSSMEVISAGFVFKKDKTGITICQGFSKNGTPLSAQFIPLGMIRKIKKVKY
jgi:hypothetical protein